MSATWHREGKVGELFRYLVAIAFVAVATLVSGLLWSRVQPAIGLLFTAVMLSAWYGGVGPGLLASLLSAVATEVLTHSPSQPVEFGWRWLLRLFVFLTCTGVISFLSGSLRRTEQALRRAHDELERRVEERTAELRAANRQMQQEIAERLRAEREILHQQEQLRQLASELSRAEEKQLRQVAAELHDGIGQLLATAQIRLDLLQARSAPPETSAEAPGRGADEQELDRIRGLIEEAIQRTRSLTVELSPPVLYELGFEPAIRWLAGQVRERHGIDVAVETHGEVSVDDERRTFLFRAVRELLVNMAKHSAARHGKVTLSAEEGCVRVRVEDDGVGMAPSTPGPPGPVDRARRNSFGLFNIRERLKHYGGRLEADARPGAGCRFTLVLPEGKLAACKEVEPWEQREQREQWRLTTERT